MLTCGENNEKISLLIKIKQIKDLAYREHYQCEDDGYYSCPKSPGKGSPFAMDKANVSTNKCLCGAGNHNAKVEKLYREIISSIK